MYGMKYDLSYLNEPTDREFQILSSVGTDYGDTKFQCLLFENEKEVGDVIISLEIDDNTREDLMINEVKDYLNEKFDNLINLPKISECSPLLQEIYETVATSDSNMCHIDSEDWKEYWSDQYSLDDVEILKQEVNKYNLDEVLEIGDLSFEYFIIGYGDLDTRFNDDRKFEKDEDLEL